MADLLPEKKKRMLVAKSLEVTNVDLVPGNDALDNLVCEYGRIARSGPIMKILNKPETDLPDKYAELREVVNKYVDEYRSSETKCITSDSQPDAESALDDPGRGRDERVVNPPTKNRIDKIEELHRKIDAELTAQLKVEYLSDDDRSTSVPDVTPVKAGHVVKEDDDDDKSTATMKTYIDEVNKLFPPATPVKDPEINFEKSSSGHKNSGNENVHPVDIHWLRSAIDNIVPSIEIAKTAKTAKTAATKKMEAYHNEADKELKIKPKPAKSVKVKTIPILKFTDVSGLLEEIKKKVEKQKYSKEQFNILQRAICMSHAYSHAKDFQAQVALYYSFKTKGWEITPDDMDTFFSKDGETFVSGFDKGSPSRITWQKQLITESNVRFVVDPSVKVFFELKDHSDKPLTKYPERMWQTAYYSNKIYGPMLHMSIQSNRINVIVRHVLNTGETIPSLDGLVVTVDENDTVVQKERAGQDEDETIIGYGDDICRHKVWCEGFVSDMTNTQPDDSDEDVFVPGVHDDGNERREKAPVVLQSVPDESGDGNGTGYDGDGDGHSNSDSDSDGSKHGGKKSISQKRGGFIKGILKNMSTCGCNKKTRRRNGKKFTVRKRKGKGKGHGKGKKMGGKRTIRKKLKTGGVKDRRVRFTVKN